MVLHEDVFGFLLPAYVGQGSPGQKKGKKRLTDKFPKMTKLETVWLRMALKLYRSLGPCGFMHLREDSAAASSKARPTKQHYWWQYLNGNDPDESFWAIKCILALIAAKWSGHFGAGRTLRS